MAVQVVLTFVVVVFVVWWRAKPWLVAMVMVLLVDTIVVAVMVLIMVMVLVAVMDVVPLVFTVAIETITV